MRERGFMVKEIFGPTIQGEGSAAGTVVKFLRFAGCNRWTGLEKDRAKSICHFCDTDFRGGTKMTTDEIIEKLDALGSCRTVVISGGEASLQLNEALLKALKVAGYTVHLETNGSNDLTSLRHWIDHITMSPKQPLSETKLKECDDLKLLFPFINPEISIEGFKEFPAKARYLQPVWEEAYTVNLAQALYVLYQNPTWKLSLQKHKIIGVA